MPAIDRSVQPGQAGQIGDASTLHVSSSSFSFFGFTSVVVASYRVDVDPKTFDRSLLALVVLVYLFIVLKEMVAFLPALSIWVVGLFCVVQLFKPRLPTYSFRIQNMVPNFIHNRFKARLGAGVKLTNHNFVHIDIHALSFDLFYPDWKGSLNHIGHVHDAQQRMDTSTSTSTESNNKGSAITDAILSSSPPLWALLPRQSFETTDEVFMQPHGNLGVLSSLSWDVLRLGGTLQVPSSGVIHLKANSRVPMTLSIMCDNILDTWSLEMQGVSCELYAMDLGWLDLPDTVQRLRSKVMELSQEREELLGRKTSSSFDQEYERLIKRVDWREAMPMLAL
jgi:hypothetical protein